MNLKFYLVIAVILFLISVSFSFYANSEMNDREDELEVVKSKLKEKENEVENLESKVSSLEKKVENIQDELDDCEDEKSSLSDEKDDLDYRNRMNLLQQTVPEDERIQY